MQDGAFPSPPGTIAQTADGYLWITTKQGLLRFDGVRFSPWEPPPGTRQLPTKDVRSLLADRDGSLWIGTGGGIAHLLAGRLITFPKVEGVVEQIIQDSQGTIWFTRGQRGPDDTEGPLCEIRATELLCHGQNDGVPFRDAQALTEDRDGAIWVGSSTQLIRWKDGKLLDRFAPTGLSSLADLNGVSSIIPGKDGSMWVGMFLAGSGLGVQQIVGHTWTPIRRPGFDSSRLNTSVLYRDHEGTLWIGTVDHGLYRIKDDQVDHFDTSDGLSGDSVSQIMEDHEGNVWITTGEGLDRFRALPVTTYSMKQGLSSPVVSSVFASRTGNLWVATGAGIDILDGSKIRHLTAANGLPGKVARSVFQASDGTFWIAVDDKLVAYSNGSMRTINLPSGKPFGSILSITEDRDHRLWVVTMGDTTTHVYRVSGFHTQEESFPADLPPVFSIAARQEGGLWLGLLSGDLASYQDGKLTVYPEQYPGTIPPGTPGVTPLRNIVEEEDGTVFAAFAGGLIEWRKGISKALTVKNGLPCRYVTTFLTDKNDTLYLYLSCAVVSITKDERERWWATPDSKLALKVYDASDGARTDVTYNSPSAARTPDGRLWFAGSESVLQMVDPSRLAFNALRPPVVIESITDDGNDLSPQQGMRLPPNPRSLRLDYTALSFSAPPKMRFRYRLDGFDEDWQEAGTRRQAFYNDLHPGSYRFRVIASNNDGVWNEEGATLDLWITPALYQRLWFRLLIGAVLCLLIWLLYLQRLKTATENVRARLLDRLAERERIARELHDTLLQGFQGLILSFQSVALHMSPEDPNQEFMSQALSRADSVLSEGRDEVRNLRAEKETAASLPDSISYIAREMLSGKPNEFDLRVSGTVRMLNPALREEVYRIAREAILNAIQHSAAKKIEVRLRYGRFRFEMTVQDNGMGISQEVLEHGRPGHWGLTGMRERAANIRGDLKVSSTADVGTEVRLSLPSRLAYITAKKIQR